MISNNKRNALIPLWCILIRKTLLFAAVFLLSPLCQQIVAKTVTDPFVLIIDPGHGGKDHGASENGIKEKDINLAVAKYLAKLLEKKKDNIKVVMTRDKDNFITLQRRADIANENKGNLFISIHTNSVDKSNKNRKNISGSSVYTLGLNKDENNMKVAQRENAVIELENDYSRKYSGFDPTKDESYIIFQMAQKKDLIQSIKFAEQAQSKLVSNAHRDNRGVHQAGFWVLWATSMPAVLVELDFICNPKAAKYLSSETGHKEMAEALYEAIVNYVEAFEQKNKDTVKAGMKNNNRSKTKTSAVQSQTLKSCDRRRRSEYSKASSEERNFELVAINDAMWIGGQSVDTEMALSEEEIYPQELEAEEITEDSKTEPTASYAHQMKGKGNSVVRVNSDGTTTLQPIKKKASPDHKARREKFETVYRIQLFASTDYLPLTNPMFQGLTPINTIKENNIYKYVFGESTQKKEIEMLLGQVRKKIPGAFIITTKRSKK